MTQKNPPTYELHELFNGRLAVYQGKSGYRFSVDSILLGAFAAQRVSGSVADLGTGCGILPIIIHRHTNGTHITGIEIQEDLAALARKNIKLGACGPRVSIACADIRDHRAGFSPETFDCVITNPPFYAAGTGRVNPDSQNAIARHELYGTLQDFVDAGAFLLRLSGKFLTIYRAARVVDLVTTMRRKNIEPKTLQFVHSRGDEPATMVLVEGVKGAGTEATVLPPLVLYQSEGVYSDQAQAIFDTI